VAVVVTDIVVVMAEDTVVVGEGIVVIDGSPAKMSREVVANM